MFHSHHSSVPVRSRRFTPLPFCLTALASFIAASTLQAQVRDTAAGAALLEEITVTATRQEASANSIPMSISALSQESLTLQGIKSGADLQRLVPGLQFSLGGGDRNPNFTIRGISSGTGSATTGFYLDDAALQRRTVPGLLTGGGSPFPNLYDVARVEVLRGPQGTLYGDSSEGGTIRFITPTPSLTEYSGRMRLDGSQTDKGAPSKEIGLAFGGPLIPDVLGFRVSGNYTRTGGYVDSKSLYNGETFAENINWSESKYVRLATLWQVNDRVSIMPAIYSGVDYSNDDGTVMSPSEQISWSGSIIRSGIPNPAIDYSKYGPNSKPVVGFTTAGRPTANGNYRAGVGQIAYNDPNGVSRTYYYAALDQEVPAFTQNAMPWYNFDSNGNGYYKSTAPGDAVYIPSPRTTRLTLPSLVVDVDLDWFAVKSVTSYVSDRTNGYSFSGGNGGTRNLGTPYIWGTTACDPNVNRPRPGLNPGDPLGCYRSTRYVPGFPQYADWYNYESQRKMTSEELRFSSNSKGRLSWVGGLYFSDSTIHMHGRETSNENAGAMFLSGVSSIWRGGGYYLPQWGIYTPAGTGAFDTWQQDVSDRESWTDEKTSAIFAEGNYDITDKLTLTLGLRYNKYKQNFRQQYGALVAGLPQRITIPGLEADGFFPLAANVQAVSADPTKPNSATNPIVDLLNPNIIKVMFPTDVEGCPNSPDCNMQYTRLASTETNTTPKVALGYQISDTNMVYGIYTKGFRPGGVNPPVPASGQCQQALADLGLEQSPLTYNQDQVTSYELGNKARLRVLDGTVQVNSALFYIDWTNMQYTQNVACGFSYINNAGSAVSKGGELQVSGRFGPFGIGFNAGYTRAQYAETIYSNPNKPGGLLTVTRMKGDNIGNTAPWTFSVSPQYDFRVADNDGYVRFDYSYTPSYKNASLAEKEKAAQGIANAYNPITEKTLPNYNLNARAGINVNGVGYSLYINNLNNREAVHRYTGTTDNGDSNYMGGIMLRPRTIGVQVNYDF
ncbi:MAG: TonB-dependent receptor [Pseudomonadales bacterium]|jgi:outer membrane receptor protein involved in Fe transport|nr:TonB-dependent receptor [Pseudomonadales bacterium]